MLIHYVMWVWFYDMCGWIMTFKTNLRSDWRRLDPGAGDNSTCTLLPDPDSCEGAGLARLTVLHGL